MRAGLFGARKSVVLALVFSASGATALVAQQNGSTPPQPGKLTLETYLDLEDVQDPQLSPDGKQVIYTRRYIDKLADRWESSLWVMNADGSRSRHLIDGANAIWSPDGSRIAYLANGDPSGTQIWVRFMDGDAAPTQITRLSETPSDVEWAPDGKSLAFRMLVPLKEDGLKIAMPSTPKGAKWVEPPRVVTKLQYRRDRQGFVDDGFRQLFIVPADGGTPRQVTSGPWEHGAPKWTPDGKTLVFSSLRTDNAEYAWRESEIYAVDVASGNVRQLTNRKGPDNNPTVSPTGKYVAYTGFDSTNATWQDSKLYIMNVDGSNRRVLTEQLDRSPQSLTWAPDESGLYYTIESEGWRNVYFSPLAGGARPITKGSQMLSITSMDKNGTMVGVVSTSLKPNDVAIFSAKNTTPKQLTAVNDDILAGKTLGQVEEIWYPTNDGMRIQGWIVKPPNFDAKKKYPMMLSIHGGPHSMYNGAFNYAWQEHASNGYVVLYTNPRGSTGYGSAFGNAIKNAYPGKDFNDLMAGVDTVIGRGYIDTRNLFVYGCSGGGVLTAWTVGHTDRFAAAVSMCPVINWMSFVGTTDGASWYNNFEKYPWEDPTEHLKRSPLMYVGNVKTPTLLMTGVNDLRTPISQTEEFYEALKVRKVPTAMVRFNDEWHGTSSKPSNFMRTQLYLQGWFARYATKGAVTATQE